MIITSTGYTFNPANKTVTFNTSTGQPLPPSLESILTIANCSSSNSKGERLLYQPQAGDDLSGSWNSATSTLTLAVNCAGMQSSDRLQILFEDQAALKVNVVAASAGIGGSATSTSELQAAGNQLLTSIDSRVGTTGSGAPALPTDASGLTGLVQVFYQALLDRLPATLSGGRLQVAPSLAADAATATNQNIINNCLGTTNSLLSEVSSDLSDLNNFVSNPVECGSSEGLLMPEGSSPDPLNPYGAALQTTLRDPIQLDQSVPAVIGGIDPTGAAQRARVGRDGGLQLTDGPTFTGTTAVANSSPTGWIDTTGYQSIVVTFNASFSGGSGVLRFHTTNDISASTNTLTNASGWPTTGAPTPAASLSGASAGTTWVFPVTAKWFRLAIGTLTSGSVSVTVTLRAAPAVFIPLALAVGGVDFSATNRTLITDTVGYQAMVGALPVGFQVGTFNVNYGRFTQALTSQTAAQSNPAPLMIGGIDSANVARAALTDSQGAMMVTPSSSTQAAQSQDELLYQILATLRTQCHYLYEIMTDSTGRSASDEPDTLIGEYMNQANQFKNFTN